MSIRLESVTLRNPSPRFNRAASSMALRHAPPASLGFEALSRGKVHWKVPVPALPRVIGVNLQQRNVRNRSVLSFAASHEESKASDIDIEKEKEDLKVGAQESQEAWQQTLASFKEQALKMQSVSKEAYELYSEKATVILKETSEKLKIQAEKASQDLSVIAKEIAEESKEYLATAAENYPEPVKDVIETFSSSTDDFNDVSKLQDFHVGIPYGALLSVGGFLLFMLTGSIPAMRFGIILGGSLLALSISSLRLSKKGERAPLVVKGQAAIATILFLRELRLLSMRPFIANFITTLISGAVVAFYLYRIIKDRRQESGGSHLEVEPQN
ncbi:putative membrane protein [Handroanthus impetiginosus]|uniref:Putative membrane protein n=1 Tax=Handroanthus impetiginosus TaxID=429701 RepID=A0A2G9HV25_9LAMI|nr:putative membrane protein [Handroanthus impetiginosus]